MAHVILKFHWGTRHLHQLTKYTRVESDEFRSKTTKMKRRLKISFELDIPVLRDFTVTNESVPSGTQTYFAFIEAEKTNEGCVSAAPSRTSLSPSV